MGAIVANGVTYGKPNMASLEGELGRRIMETIRSTPPLDLEKLRRECDELGARMDEERSNGTY